ncbi:MAG TPA: NAD(P)-dependent oxidoreductase [Acidimicrobiales bacterium]|nr:NAD(P)-dependent oxidoreductase [Acidimicrobiales bacterium]
MKIAVLGIGQMGHALASRLLDTGFELTVWNRSPGRAGDLVARGAREADNVPVAVAGATVVMTSLSNDAAVTDVLLPGGSPLPLANGGAVVECSTISPDTTRRLAAIYGDHLVAAPILGGPAALAAGEAALVVAGPKDTVADVRPALEAVSGAIRLCGPDPGTALVIKLLNNSLLLTGLAAVSEAVAAGQRAGLDNELLVDLFGSSPLVAAGLRNRIEDLVKGDHDGWFTPAQGAKDLGLFLDLAASPERPLPIAELARDRYREAAAEADGADLTAVIELLRR